MTDVLTAAVGGKVAAICCAEADSWPSSRAKVSLATSSAAGLAPGFLVAPPPARALVSSVKASVGWLASTSSSNSSTAWAVGAGPVFSVAGPAADVISFDMMRLPCCTDRQNAKQERNREPNRGRAPRSATQAGQSGGPAATALWLKR